MLTLLVLCTFAAVAAQTSLPLQSPEPIAAYVFDRDTGTTVRISTSTALDNPFVPILLETEPLPVVSTTYSLISLQTPYLAVNTASGMANATRNLDNCITTAASVWRYEKVCLNGRHCLRAVCIVSNSSLGVTARVPAGILPLLSDPGIATLTANPAAALNTPISTTITGSNPASVDVTLFATPVVPSPSASASRTRSLSRSITKSRSQSTTTTTTRTFSASGSASISRTRSVTRSTTATTSIIPRATPVWMTLIGLNGVLVVPIPEPTQLSEVAPYQYSGTPQLAIGNASEWTIGLCFSRLISPLAANGWICSSCLNVTVVTVNSTNVCVGSILAFTCLSPINGTVDTVLQSGSSETLSGVEVQVWAEA